MAWHNLNSTNLHSFDYDDAQRILHIRFHTGGHYSYQDVPQEVAKGLKEAGSPGSYFHSHIKNRYAFR